MINLRVLITLYLKATQFNLDFIYFLVLKPSFSQYFFKILKKKTWNKYEFGISFIAISFNKCLNKILRNLLLYLIYQLFKYLIKIKKNKKASYVSTKRFYSNRI